MPRTLPHRAKGKATGRTAGAGQRQLAATPPAEGADAAAEGSEPAAGRPPPKQTLKIEQVLAELEGAAPPIGVRVTYEALGGELGSGGICKVKGQWRVIIDKRATPSERVSVLAPALARFTFDESALSEPVRELLQRLRPAAPPATHAMHEPASQPSPG